MASYSTMSTIPAADVETEQPLLKRDVKLNVKTVLAGAAAAAFILGAAAATALTTPAAPKQMSLGAQYFPKAVNIELASDHDDCLMFSNKGTPLRVKGCSKHGGQFRQIIGADDTVKYEAFLNEKLTGECITALRGGADEFEEGMSFGSGPRPSLNRDRRGDRAPYRYVYVLGEVRRFPVI